MAVLAACSPSHYSGEQVARTVSRDSVIDSVSYQRMIDAAVQEEIQRRLDIQEWTMQTTVTEKLSGPDSAGAQHVTERQTTTISKRSETSAVSAQIKEEKKQEKRDSSSIRMSDSIEIAEEEKRQIVEAKSRIPWYCYVLVLALSAAVGFLLGLRVKNKR